MGVAIEHADLVNVPQYRLVNAYSCICRNRTQTGVCDAQDFSIDTQTARANSYIPLLDGRTMCSAVLEPLRRAIYWLARTWGARGPFLWVCVWGGGGGAEGRALLERRGEGGRGSRGGREGVQGGAPPPPCRNEPYPPGIAKMHHTDAFSISLGDGGEYANFLGFGGSVPLLPHLCAN